MESHINVCIVNGYSSDEGLPSQYENVYIVNNWSGDDAPSHYDNVFVVNGLPYNDWPRPYYNILIWNGASDEESRPSYIRNVYVVNFEVLKTIRSVRRAVFPSVSFYRCSWCLREFEGTRYSLDKWVRCPHCGREGEKFTWEL